MPCNRRAWKPPQLIKGRIRALGINFVKGQEIDSYKAMESTVEKMNIWALTLQCLIGRAQVAKAYIYSNKIY
jgi:hypothetical protein